MSLLKLLMHLSPLLVAHLFVSGNTTVYESLTRNTTVVSSGPDERRYKSQPSPSPQGITPPSPSPPTLPLPPIVQNKTVTPSPQPLPPLPLSLQPLPPLPLPPLPIPPLGIMPPSPSPQGIMPPKPSPQGITPRPSPRIRPKTPRSLVPIIAGVIGSALLIIAFVVIFVLRARWRGKSEQDQQDLEDDHIKHVPGMPVRFSYQELYVATDNFNERLGRGGFGSVFKGKLGDGTQIAVKRLEKLGQGMSAFLAEAEAIGSLHHFNLVRLIGFCAEKSSRLLVFEYLSNGSLDNWIFMNVQRPILDWQTRKKIIVDIAKGLAYLHEDCRHTIIHLDVKPQNILLDSSFQAKIADFGLSKLINRDMRQVQISMRGTPGYLAPEWRQPLGRITVKADIYSFGIVLLEIVCARRNVDQSQPESAFHLLTMLQKKGDQDRVIDIVENLDEYTRSDREEITRMIKVAAWCLQDDPERRPLMSTVLKVLEGVMEVDSNINYRFSHAMLQLVTTIFLQHLLQHLFFPILDDVVVRLPLLVASATFPSCYPKLTTAFLALV